MESWRSQFAQLGGGVQIPGSSAISTFRCLSWGIPMPMTPSEDKVHGAFARGMDMPWPPANNSWRPFYVISKTQIDGSTIVTALLTHPATSTADCEVPEYSSIMKTRDVDFMLRVIAHPSNGESRTSLVPNSEGRIKGRYSMRAIDMSVPQSRMSSHTNRWSPSFVSLSHSSLIFVVSRHGKTWTCLPSSSTLQQILRVRSPDFLLTENLSRVMVKPRLMSGMD
ncbi:uncharacterized protein MEPE_00170 [Melanopsichium pennsylvanicum]|uniref:Uncharacterized protein n=2 Tax=Melanopsichium pennsylvanicum TaxID=63383 RepID=A0AAJ5C2D9_9BASI|nr:uncharacterized protein BN887_02000 [Melanopsichium pennsylvanicum 4]SNX81465.1 uncharacterized protein MEPE_00170 [Melanopsichium pennsylvanicum]